MVSYDKLIEKWSPVLNEESAGNIKDHHRKAVTAAVLENQEIALREEGMIQEAAPANATSSVQNWNPVLIALVRRAMPNLMAYDICGVQPMSGPTGLIFAMKSLYKTTRGGATAGDEALFDEAITPYSGDSSASQGSNGPSGLSGIDSAGAGDVSGDSSIDSERTTDGFGGGMTTANAEGLGSSGAGPNTAFAEMGFSIEKSTVTAKSRALKAEYSLELAQDLKAIHGLDAETELANILSTEILAEINSCLLYTSDAADE